MRRKGEIKTLLFQLPTICRNDAWNLTGSRQNSTLRILIHVIVIKTSIFHMENNGLVRCPVQLIRLNA